MINMHLISPSNNFNLFDTEMNTLLIFELCYAGSVDLITRQDQDQRIASAGHCCIVICVLNK
jgi:hypothetical protein